MTADKLEANADASDILSTAVSNALDAMLKEWSPEKELGFVMVRRAMRHLSVGHEDMY